MPIKMDTPASRFYTEAQPLFERLYARWIDERGLERISEYAAPFAELITKHGLTDFTMTGLPFGCTFKAPVDGTTGKYKIVINTTQYEYRRVG